MKGWYRLERHMQVPEAKSLIGSGKKNAKLKRILLHDTLLFSGEEWAVGWVGGVPENL